MFELGRSKQKEPEDRFFEPEDDNLGETPLTPDTVADFAIQAVMTAMVAKIAQNAEAGDPLIVPLPTDMGPIPDAAHLRAEIASLGADVNPPLVSAVFEGEDKAIAVFQCV